MADQVTNYKCPACTGPLHFEGKTGKLECEYCGSSYEVAEIEAMYAEAEAKAAEAQSAADKKKEEQAAKAEKEKEAGGESWDTQDFENWGLDEGMKAYSCPSCGAELICDESTAATCCPYCGNPTVVPGQFAGGLKPDYIIPFKLDQKAAEAALANHYKGKKLLPDGFATGNRIREIKGVYVPFWLFDGEAEADTLFDASNSRRFKSGDYEITETEHYHVRRAGTVQFEKIPVDASTKMPDEHMDAIEPFDYSELTGFSTAYLPGYLADKYDISLEDSAERADERARATAVDAMRADVKQYQSCSLKDSRVDLKRGKAHYGLLPVYMLGTKWEGSEYLFAMNGQTGKLIGDLPYDKGKYWKYFGAVTAGVTAVLGTLLFLML
ncbi:MAG: hypothetical protein Q4B03_09990 [Lachnospiraceae bacterium]|nr:hypothetical protein [Lachnospiraceae bacterium]